MENLHEFGTIGWSFGQYKVVHSYVDKFICRLNSYFKALISSKYTYIQLFMNFDWPKDQRNIHPNTVRVKFENSIFPVYIQLFWLEYNEYE